MLGHLAPASEADLHAEVARFLYREARLADEHCYDEWETLWTDEALYWVPIDEEADPATSLSYIYDNRARIASRIRQLNTGRRHAQAPASEMRRIISNIEIAPRGDRLEVGSNFILIESRRGLLTTWAGRTSHILHPAEDGFRMSLKKILLVNRRDPITNLAFLI